jgi:hypothetical protein
MQNVLLFKKNERYKICIFLEKRKKKQDINVVLLIKIYNNFVNFLCSWRSVDTVGIRWDENGGKNLPAGDGDGGRNVPEAGNGARSGKIPSAQSPPR